MHTKKHSLITSAKNTTDRKQLKKIKPTMKVKNMKMQNYLNSKGEHLDMEP